TAAVISSANRLQKTRVIMTPSEDMGANPASNRSAVPDYQYVAVLDDVLLAFQAQQAFLAHARVSAMVDQRLPVHRFGPDELFLKVAVNRSGRLDGCTVHRDSPGADLGLPGGQERHQAKQSVRGGDQALQTRFLQAIARQVFLRLFGRQLRELRLDLAAD